MPGDRKGDLARGRFADGVDVSDDLRLNIWQKVQPQTGDWQEGEE